MKPDTEPKSVQKILDIGGSHNPKLDATHLLDIDRDIRSNKQYEFIYWDLNKLPLPFKDNTFDKIYCDNVIEHLQVSPEILFAEIYRILNHKSNFIFACPNTIFYYNRLVYLFGLIPQDYHKEHIKHYSHDYIYRCFLNAGFKVKIINNLWHLLPIIKNFQGNIRFIVRKA